MKDKHANMYEVTDMYNRTYEVKADGYVVSGEGLQFYMNDIRVAWFRTWANFVLKGDK